MHPGCWENPEQEWKQGLQLGGHAEPQAGREGGPSPGWVGAEALRGNWIQATF